MSKRDFDDTNLTKKVVELNKKAMKKSKVVSILEYKKIHDLPKFKTLLVVDDEKMICQVVKRIFEKENFRVLSAKDAMEFSHMISNIEIDVVLLDINLPWVSGYDLCLLLKNHPTLKDVPVIFISGNIADKDVEKGYHVGCDDYVKKPFDMTEIQNAVNKALTLERPRPAV